jgi:hypothetical protein
MCRNQLALSAMILGLSACSDSHSGRSETGGALPSDPGAFRIELSATACFGACPVYHLAIDQQGDVEFFGERCVARPGAFEQTVPAADARAVYDALLATPYASLGERYVHEEDGCELITDAPTYTWWVMADGKKKALVHYAGCLGIDALKKVDAVRATFHERANVLQHLGSGVDCFGSGPRPFPTQLLLSQAGAPLATLTIEAENSFDARFTLQDCAGSMEVSGRLRSEPNRWILLTDDGTAFALSAALGNVGSIVVDLDERAGSRTDAQIKGVRAFRPDDELTFDFAATDRSCAQP